MGGETHSDIGLLIDGYHDANLEAIYDHPALTEVETEMGEDFLHQALSAGIIASRLKPIVDGSPQLRKELQLILDEITDGGGNHPVIVGLSETLKTSVMDTQRVFAIFKKFLA